MFDTSSQTGPAVAGPSILGGDTTPSGTPSSSAQPIPPIAAAPPPMFGAQGTTRKQPKKSQGTFMGNAAYTPSANQLGANTLLGQ